MTYEPVVLACFGEGRLPFGFIPIVEKIVTAYGELTAAELNEITRTQLLLTEVETGEREHTFEMPTQPRSEPGDADAS